MNSRNRTSILVLDDEEDIRILVSDFLQRNGYETYVASSLREARHLLAEAPIQLVISDLVVGEEDGLSFLCELRSAYPQVPVLILTGIGYDEEALQEAHHNGAAGYLSKTLGLDQLLMEIHRILAISPAHAHD